ncbi:MAG TPA: lysophospholipid acyltransferase family protein [Candidatus Acidoferrales bacterium]|nr:lysophospholipid acyltransferase family protein [Candidatus Acidoferrales bacterium]
MKDWRYDTAADLEEPIIERLRRFPREPDMLVYGLRSLAALGLRGWLRVYHRLEIIGRENLPSDGSFVMVANHSSHLDALCLLAALPLRELHRAFPAAASDYFFTSIPRVALSAVVVNALPFRRTTHIRQSLALCRQLLANPGNILIIFPEGTRSVTGQVNEFKSGIGILVAGTTIPVVPCYLSGAFAAWPKGNILPRPKRLRLILGAPRRFESVSPNHAGARRVADELRRAVMELKPSLTADQPRRI